MRLILPPSLHRFDTSMEPTVTICGSRESCSESNPKLPSAAEFILFLSGQKDPADHRFLIPLSVHLQLASIL